MTEQTNPTEASKVHKRKSWRLTILVILCVFGIAGVIAWQNGVFTPKPRIALVTWNDDPFWDLVTLGAEDSASELNADLSIIRCKPTVDDQTQHLQALVAQGVDGIAVSPKDPDAETALFNDIASQKVLITFDSDAPQSHRRGFVGTDDYGAGQMAAQEIRDAIPDGGEVIISVGGIKQSNGRDRRQGLIDDLLDRSFKRDRPADAIDAQLKGSKYEIVATVLDDGDPQRAVSLVADAIKAHPDVKCIAGLFSYSAPAIVQAINQSGKSGQIKVVGFDETDATQAGVESGVIYSSILQSQYRCGYETARLLLDAIRGIEDKGPMSGARLTALPIFVMRASNMQDLRVKHVIHQPKSTAS